METTDDACFWRHLYISMGKLNTFVSGVPKTIEDLIESYNNATPDEREKMLDQWLENERLFTLRRQQDIGLGTDELTTMVKAWQLLQYTVTKHDSEGLRSLWRILSYFGVADTDHAPLSWHLAAMIHLWIAGGVTRGRIRWDESESFVCQHVMALQCYMNMSAVEGEVKIRSRWAKAPHCAFYMLRFSISEPGVVVLQYGMPGSMRADGKELIMNLRITTKVWPEYEFFASAYDYTEKCKQLISKDIGNATTRFIRLTPSLREMLGMTNTYSVYFGDMSPRETFIPLRVAELHPHHHSLVSLLFPWRETHGKWR